MIFGTNRMKIWHGAGRRFLDLQEEVVLAPDTLVLTFASLSFPILLFLSVR